MIATVSGLTAAAGLGKFSRAQDDGLPDASAAIDFFAPVAAPPMRFVDSQGKHLGLGDYAGHPLLVNLWATWCGPCVDELPTFAGLAPKFAAFGGLILPISIDVSGVAAVAPFFNSHNIRNLPVLLDPNGENMQVLGSNGVPVTVIINAGGQMVGRLDGAADWDTAATLKYLATLGGRAHGAPDGFMPV